MEEKIIRKHKFFAVDNFEKEAKYLEKMAEKGYLLINVETFFGSSYIFEKTEPKKVKYVVNYIEKEDDNQEYYNIAKDMGWTYVGECMGLYQGKWTYFYIEVEDEKVDFFTDNESKINLLQKVRKTWGLFGLMMFLCGFSNLIHTINNLINGYRSEPIFSVQLLLSIFTIFVWGLFLKILINLSFKIHNLRKVLY